MKDLFIYLNEKDEPVTFLIDNMELRPASFLEKYEALKARSEMKALSGGFGERWKLVRYSPAEVIEEVKG